MGEVKEIRPGTPVFRFRLDPENLRKAILNTAWMVHRRGSWRRFRNIRTGQEWNEQGMNYELTIKAALGEFILGCEYYIKPWGYDMTVSQVTDAVIHACGIFKQQEELARRNG